MVEYNLLRALQAWCPFGWKWILLYSTVGHPYLTSLHEVGQEHNGRSAELPHKLPEVTLGVAHWRLRSNEGPWNRVALCRKWRKVNRQWDVQSTILDAFNNIHNCTYIRSMWCINIEAQCCCKLNQAMCHCRDRCCLHRWPLQCGQNVISPHQQRSSSSWTNRKQSSLHFYIVSDECHCIVSLHI